MLGMIYKDLMVVRKYFLAIFFVLVLPVCIVLVCAAQLRLSGGPLDDDGLFSIAASSTCMYLMFFTLVGWGESESFIGSDRTIWQFFAVSTPGGMKAQIQAKYVAVFLMNMAMASLCVLIDAGMVLACETQMVSALSAVLVLLCWNLLKEAIVLPFIWALGPESGRRAKGFVLLGLMTLVGIYLLYGDISIFMREDFPQAFMEGLSTEKIVWGLALAPYVVGLLYYLSYRISLKVCRIGLEKCE